MQGFKKIKKSFTNQYHSFFGFNTKQTPRQTRAYIETMQQLENIDSESKANINHIVNNRYRYAVELTPLAICIEKTTNQMISTPLLFKQGETILDKNPLKELFKLSISTYHQGYDDFMQAVITNYCFLDGNLFVLIKKDIINGELITIDVLRCDCMIATIDPTTKTVTRYTINNSPAGATLILDLDLFTRSYKGRTSSTDVEYELLTTEIAFESGDILQKSPLKRIGLSATLLNAALARGISLNKKSTDGQFIMYPVATERPEEINAITQDLKNKMEGSTNAGANVLMTYTGTAGQSGAEPKVIKFGNGYKDYDIHTDIGESDKRIYEAFGVPASIIRQDAKYSGNQEETKKQWYEITLIPNLNRVLSYLEKWRLLMYAINQTGVGKKGIPCTIEVDTSKIKAFEASEATYVQSLSVLTINEKRAKLGYDPLPDGDILSQSTISPTKTDLKNI